VLEAVRMLEADGYLASFTIDAGLGCDHPFDALLAERVFRFEGPSDPDEEAIVLGVRCSVCATRGTIVSGYGPSADPVLIERLTLLESRFRAG
jgi:hypothetical protein